MNPVAKLAVSSDKIESHYQIISKIGNLGSSPKDGYLRAAYSAEETAAMQYFEHEAKKLEFFTRWDQIGNLYIELPGQTNEYVETGSHLDTVPLGGNFDGAAGVVAGFEALKQLKNHSKILKRGIRLRIWRAEESATFGITYCGSSAAFGQLDPKFLIRSFNGISLEDAMRSQGVNLEFVRNCKASISQAEIDGIYAHIELHIEQGNLLEVNDRQIGIVTSIRGPRRTRVILKGEFDHSGATPMGTQYRKDVNLAMAHILVKIDDFASEKLSQGEDLVQTVGVINSEKDFASYNPGIYQNAVTKVSGYGYFTLDIRSIKNAFLEEYSKQVDNIIYETAQEFRVTAIIEGIASTQAVESLDLHIQELSIDSCKEFGFSYEQMPSGAGHDCVNISKQKKSNGKSVPIGMLFIPCLNGKSHNPEEYASDQAISSGASVLAQTLFKLALE